MFARLFRKIRFARAPESAYTSRKYNLHKLELNHPTYFADRRARGAAYMLAARSNGAFRFRASIKGTDGVWITRVR